MKPSALFDKRVQCWSILTDYAAKEYLKLVRGAYEQRGGLEFQRDKLKTTTAKRIRNRMVSDILQGAVLPPVVIGIVVPFDLFESIKENNISEKLSEAIDKHVDGLSIIDGMQRTSALMEADEDETGSLSGLSVRVEFWISNSVESLIYRMLVLNTGQIPWNLSRQLQVVYAPLVEEIKKKVKFTRLLDTNRGERRTKAGEFAPDNIVELFIAFGLRKTEYDTKETLADEFSRLDMADALSGDYYKDFFYPVVQMMIDLDCAFSGHDPQIEKDAVENLEGGAEIKKGRSIFDRKPARVGFVVAAANFILGRIGMPKEHKESEAALSALRAGTAEFVAELEKMDQPTLVDFLRLDILEEKLSGSKRSAVGRFEREYFYRAFELLIAERFKVPSMEPSWRS